MPIGCYSHDGEHLLKVVSLPLPIPRTDLAAITFLQIADAAGRSIHGSCGDLQQRRLDILVKAIGSTWQGSGPRVPRGQ